MAKNVETTSQTTIITKKSKRIFLVALLALVTTFCSRTDGALFSEFQSTNGDWQVSDVKKFTFEQKDSLEKYNVYLQLQANNNYPFSNIFLIAKIHTPDSKTYTDTLQYMMTDETGKLLGDGFTDTKTSKLLYKENYSFAQNGIYTIEVEQAVRKAEDVEGATKLEGITGVGLTIEKQ